MLRRLQVLVATIGAALVMVSISPTAAAMMILLTALHSICCFRR